MWKKVSNWSRGSLCQTNFFLQRVSSLSRSLELKIMTNISSPSTTRDQIESRYCKRWLGIENTPAEIEAYDNCVTQGGLTLPQVLNQSRPPHQPSNDLEPAQADILPGLPFGTAPTPSQLIVAAPNASHSLLLAVPRDELVQMPIQSIASELHFNGKPATMSNPTSNKHARRESFDSTLAMSTTDWTSRTKFSCSLQWL
jgi:hypothetical protein